MTGQKTSYFPMPQMSNDSSIPYVSSDPTVPFLDLKAQYATIREEIRSAIDRVVESQLFILGPEVEALESDVAAYSQCAYGVGVSSGTDALLASLMALGIKSGDEVVTTPYSFMATAGSIARVGATPVFVDIDARTLNIDPDRIESAITERTRAIVPVHLFGQMADMDAVMDIAARHDLYVIEDAAQAIGAEYKGKRAGSIGHVGCLSFFPTKNLGGFGDGGMVVTNDRELDTSHRLVRNHGHSPKYFSRVMGGNFRLDAVQAAVLRVKLKHLDSWTESRQRNAAYYREAMMEAGIAGVPAIAGDGTVADGQQSTHPIVLPVEEPYRRHIYNQFVVRTKRRDELADHLRRLGISTEIYYPLPLHLQDCFAQLGYEVGDLEISERASREVLALPVYPELTSEMLTQVVEGIGDLMRNPTERNHGESL